MAGLLAAFKSKLEESEAGPSTPAAPKKKIPKVAVYVSGATVCPPHRTWLMVVRHNIRLDSFDPTLR
jgi:hypothetical protein